MSWQAYVDNQICAQVQCKNAAIAGLQDGAIWAKFEATPGAVTQQELATISQLMRTDVQKFFEKGIQFGGEKYFCLGAEDKLLRGRRDKSAFIAVATNTCLLVVATVDGFPPGTLNNCVEKLGDYLRAQNY